MNQYSDGHDAIPALEGGEELPVGTDRSLLVVFILVLIFGIGATLAGYAYFANQDRENIGRQLRVGTDALLSIINPRVAYPNPVLDEIFATLERIRENATPDVVIDQAFLDDYLWQDPIPGLDTSSIEYLPRIERADLLEDAALANRLGDDLAEDFTVLQARDGDMVPAPDRDRYFPLLVEAGYADNGETPGLDRSIDNAMIRIAMDMARDSADFIPYGIFPVVGGENQAMVSRYFYAIYDAPGVPASVEERRRSLRGFVSVATFFSMEDFAGLLPESYQGIEAVYFPATGTFPAIDGYPEAMNEMEQGYLLETPYTLTGDDNETWVAVTRATPDLLAAHVTNNRWWALFLGLLATVWLASLVYRQRRQSRRILQLVSEKTRDLSLRTEKLAEVNAALQESEGRYRMLAENVTDVIYTLTLDGICTYVSPSVTQQTGFPVEDYIGSPLARHLTPEAGKKVMPILERARQLGREEAKSRESLAVIECEIKCRDGSSRPTENKVSLVLDDTGRASGILCVSRDISERKKAEAEKRELEEAYYHSQKMEAIGTLAGGVAHDFNNLLTGILGHAELLRMSLAGHDEAAEGLEVIENASLRGRELTGQLLGFARKGRYRQLVVNLNDTVRDIGALLNRTADKRINIQCAVNDEAPVVIGDPGQLNQLILNLAVNALDAMPAGGTMSLETGIEDIPQGRNKPLDIPPGCYSWVEVRDTGKGISRDVMQHIFEPFFTDKEDSLHTGMGLAMVYGVARNHGGAVRVDSEVGKGSSFKVYLPFTDAREGKQESDEFTDAMGGKEGSILVVDDESMVREMAATMLGSMGYRVELAVDGVEAVNYYTANWKRIDLVIVDMIMPNMSGIDCLQELRTINPEVKVIITTGYSQEILTENLQQQQVYGFLQKPFRMKDLSSLVANAIH